MNPWTRFLVRATVVALTVLSAVLIVLNARHGGGYEVSR